MKIYRNKLASKKNKKRFKKIYALPCEILEMLKANIQSSKP